MYMLVNLGYERVTRNVGTLTRNGFNGGGAGMGPDAGGGGEIGRSKSGVPITSATQSVGGTNSYNTICNGDFGKGGLYGATNNDDSRTNVPGGGGWYGGAGNPWNSNSSGGSSGYVLTSNSAKPGGYIPTSKFWMNNVVNTQGETTIYKNRIEPYAKITLLDTLAPTLSTSIPLNLEYIENNNILKYSFALTTKTENTVTVVEKLNDDILSTKTMSAGKYETTIDNSRIIDLSLNSLNTITITATDSTNKTSELIFTFTKVNSKPSILVNSYNSTSATFMVSDLDSNLNKIEWYLDSVLKETITTDLYAEKTINYELTDNAIHTLKIVAIDEENAIIEKVLSISKNIMPPEEDANLNDITAKVGEIKNGLKSGKTSIVNVLAFKNIEAGLDNSFTEISEKIKTAFDSGDASIDELKNKIVEKNNSITQLNNTIASLTDVINSSKLVTGYFCYKTGKITFSASLNKPITFAMALLYNDSTYAGGAIYSNGKSVDVGVYGGSLITVNGNTAQIRFNLVPTDTNKGKEYPIYFYVKA
ncbi:hypothetical protein IC216_14135 [Clostridioides sp. ES-S-0145-01]|uniref:glycine-rich protein n=1 Tax=Clostridioides sp. ES-S-0145-01 TaxID=2770784 RepID=UPI001D0FF9D0|nr:hypothetical protein [Clostridioides sp. ES-S-0145-01]